MMSDQESRTAFEAAIRARPNYFAGMLDRGFFNPSDYHVVSINHEWLGWQAGHEAGARAHRVQKEKIAPVQGWPQGVPWSLHLEAYAAYCKKWSPQPALIDLEGRNCRGGFGTEELDIFIPGWRERVSEITTLKKRVAELESGLAEAPAASQQKREPLSVVEIMQVFKKVDRPCAENNWATGPVMFARAVERAHGIEGEN